MSSKPPTKKSTSGPKAPNPDAGKPGSVQDPCDLTIDVDLEGVRAEGLKGLVVGEKLGVRLDRAGSLRSVVCIRNDGVAVGALSSFRNLSQLLNCLERGVQYTVIVKRVAKGSCRVQGGRV